LAKFPHNNKNATKTTPQARPPLETTQNFHSKCPKTTTKIKYRGPATYAKKGTFGIFKRKISQRIVTSFEEIEFVIVSGWDLHKINWKRNQTTHNVGENVSEHGQLIPKL
jgi:hypothetical protein